MAKPKKLVYIRGEGEDSPLKSLGDATQFLVPYRSDAILEDMRQIHKYGSRVVGAYKVTIEKIDPRIWRTWNRVARKR